MKISFQWLCQLFSDGDPRELGVAEIARRLTMQGLAVDDRRRPFEELSGVVLGRVLEASPHPNADRLTLCRVAAGDGERQVVCGAPNVEVGTIYAYAAEGARLAGGREIRRARIRGVDSEGMLCSAPELGLETLGSPDGIWAVTGADEGDLGRDLVEVLGLDDEILDVDAPSNRGDVLCHLGVAREIQCHVGGRARLAPLALAETGPPGDVPVAIEDPEGCPIYHGRLIRGIRVGESPAWLQVRLLALGLRPVNNVVDATNYVMLECGQPLHPFDFGALTEGRIVVRRARPEEEIVTLDGRRRALDHQTTVIADAERAVAIGGVMGGLHSEVGDQTTDVFLEAAWFDPKRITRTARVLGLTTDAATRFARGVDPAMTVVAMDRAATLITRLAGGEVAAGRAGEAGAGPSRAPLQLRTERLARIAGRPIPPDEIRAALTSLGFTVSGTEEDRFEVEVPSWRFDVEREIDLIEEVTRLTGYDRIPMVRLPVPAVAPRPSSAERGADRIRLALRGAGYDEARTPSFVSENALGRKPAVDKLVELRNPISKSDRFLRPFVFVTLSKAVIHNVNRGAVMVRLFEIGHAFHPDAGEGPDETRRVALAAAGMRQPVDWSRAVEPLDLFDLKGDVESLLREAQVVETEFIGGDRSYLHPGRQAEIRGGGRDLGFLGEIHPRVAEEWGLDRRLYIAELELEPLLTPAPPVTAATVPREPAVMRDLALVIPDGIRSDRVVTAVREAEAVDLDRIDVFDRYAGPQVPEGHHSLGLRLTFQADRTLTDEEIDDRIDRLVRHVQEKHGYRLR